MPDLELVQTRETIPAMRPLHPEIVGNETPAVLMKKLDEYCNGFSRVSETGEHLMYWIAKVAVALKVNDGYLKKHDSFTQFVEAEIVQKHRISHGSIWQWIGVIDTLPSISGQQAKRLGTQRLTVIKRVVKKVGMTPSELNKLVKAAEELTADELMDKYPDAEDGRAAGYRVIRIPKISKRTAAAFPKWLGDRNPDKVINWLMTKHPELPADLI